MAGPMQFSLSSGGSLITHSINDSGFPGPDLVSTLQTTPLESPDLTVPAVGSAKMLARGPVPPTAVQVPEPSGVMVMFGAGLIVLGLWRPELKRLI